MAEAEVLGPNRTTGAPSLRGVLSRLTDVAWNFSHQIKRITDYVQGHAALSPSCAWLMGVSYAAQGAVDPKEALTPEVQEQLLQDFRSRVWCTYRRDFPSIGPEGLTGDVGWGCTIRSGQMMMAEVISRHVLGRNWRRDETLDLSYTSTDLLGLLSMFQDHPHAPLSIHQIIAAGRPHGMVPGKWLGPWVLCKSLAALINSRPDLGLLVHVVCDPGGGAPCLDAHALLAMMARQEDRTTRHPTATTATAIIIPNGLPDTALDDHQQPVSSAAAPHLDSDPVPSQAAEFEEAQQALAPLATSEPDAKRQVDTGPKVDASLSSLSPAKGTIEPSQKLIQGVVGNGNAVELHMHEAQGNSDSQVVSHESDVASQGEFTEQHSADVSQEPGDHGIGTGCDQVGVDEGHQQLEVQEPVAAFTRPHQHPPHSQTAQQEPPPGLLLLLPLTLGVGRVNQLYYPQLLQVLTFPQSIGIVGGRPSASLFFIGHQDLNLMYLDPHIPQQAAVLPAALPTYFCDAVRLMPITNIDPSLAIGFYCRDAGELQDLVTRLDQLAVEHRRAPLVTVTDITTGSANRQLAGVPDRQDSQMSGSWEFPHRGGDTFTVQQTRSRQKQKHDCEGEDLESWEVL